MTPLNLTDLELETAARACRALAYQEEQAAKRMENPGMRGPVENTSKRAEALSGSCRPESTAKKSRSLILEQDVFVLHVAKRERALPVGGADQILQPEQVWRRRNKR